MKLLAWVMAFLTGFLSLSQEILWVRLVGYETGGIPKAFAFVLGMFLLGIAFGASSGKEACKNEDKNPLDFAAWALLIGGCIDFLVPVLLGAFNNSYLFLFLISILVPVTAGCKATIFPIVHHIGSSLTIGKLGKSVSRVYFFNILGSTLGPLLTGFILLNYFSFSVVWNFIGFGSVALAFLIFTVRTKYLFSILSVFFASVIFFGVQSSNNYTLIERLSVGGPENVKNLVENRQGVVHTVGGGLGGDIVFGGNIYDGRTNIDLVINSNKIDRVYLLSILHPQPENILVIGLSAGAWTRVLSSFPSVSHIDAVEINPGYLDIIKEYEHLSPLLTDPRINIHIDDGRRWLKRNPTKKYDLIVINATFHWRQYSTSLLSREFLSLVNSHLSGGGIVTFNATGSLDAFYTASKVFPYAWRWSNFIYASDHDFRGMIETNTYGPWRLSIGDSMILDRGNQNDRKAVDKLLRRRFVEYAEDESVAGRSGVMITDANMVTEYLHGFGVWRLTR